MASHTPEPPPTPTDLRCPACGRLSGVAEKRVPRLTVAVCRDCGHRWASVAQPGEAGPAVPADVSPGPRTSRPRTRGVVLLLLLVAAGAAGVYGWWRTGQPITGRAVSLAQLQLTAQELNRDLPRAVDPGTELTSVIASEGRLTYNQRLISLLAAEVPASFAQSMRPGVVSAACTTPELRDTFLRAGVTLRWSYADRVGQPVAQIEVRPQDCGF